MREIHIIGGGTVSYIRPRLALAAPAYGSTVWHLHNILVNTAFDGIVHLWTTRMAGNRHAIWTARSGIDDVEPENLETNDDIADVLHRLTADPRPKVIFLPAALCDFNAAGIESFHIDPEHGTVHAKGVVGRDQPCLRSGDYTPIPPDPDDFGADTVAEPCLRVVLTPAEKVIQRVRKQRKDIFLVGFKTTTGTTKQKQFDAGLALVKQASCNLVLANDLKTRMNMVVTPEQAAHHTTTDRRQTLKGLVEMALSRSQGHFTRSTVVPGDLVPWTGETVPAALRTVVDHCIKRGAYKPFLGKTVGHFAFKVGDGHFVTSRRGVNFNDLERVGMVSVTADGDDRVTAVGAKPSVGGQSQRIIFGEHPDVDCIVHFHCPLRTNYADEFPTRPQAPHECGSHECGKNTSDGLKTWHVDGHSNTLKAVMLDKHGPNIVFNKNMNPQKVIDFIEQYWDLEKSTSEVA